MLQKIPRLIKINCLNNIHIITSLLKRPVKSLYAYVEAKSSTIKGFDRVAIMYMILI